MTPRNTSNFSALAVVALLVFLYWPEQGLEPKNVRQSLPNAELTRIAMTMQAKPLTHGDTQELISFGSKLFFDQSLSLNGKVSCATCHNPELSFTDQKTLAVGLSPTGRNTPTLINVGEMHWFFWDGRSDSLVTQALGPISAQEEHGINRGRLAQLIYKHHKSEYENNFGAFPKELSELLKSDDIFNCEPVPTHSPLPLSIASYGLATLGSSSLQKDIIHEAAKKDTPPNRLFSRKFASMKRASTLVSQACDKLSKDGKQQLKDVAINFGRALEAFQKTIQAKQSPFDKFLIELSAGKSLEQSFSKDFGAEEWLGFKTFVESSCSDCHLGSNFTDQQFHNIGLPFSPLMDLGRAKGILQLVASDIKCRELAPQERESCKEMDYLDINSIETLAAFKTPSLRNLEDTKPYMHDGRFPDLDTVLDHYENSDLEPGMGHRSESIPNLEWTAEERNALKAFLKALNSEVTFYREPGILGKK